MAEMKEYEPGTPSWVDLGSPDIDASSAFYGALFGWSAESTGTVEDTGGYRMFTLNGKNVAGLGPQMNPGSPFWTTYVSVADADATAKAITAAGGTTLVEPMTVLESGRMAVFVDAVGAPISIWQPMAHIGAELVNEPGALTWNELQTADTTAATAFYAAAFGWEAKAVPIGDRPYTLFQLGDRTIGGLMVLDEGQPSAWQVIFAVADCDGAVATCTAHGGSVVAPATDLPGVGRFAALADPHGAPFGVLESTD
jgi:predicted enzyme related to lactoylglutathione lyase